MKFDLDAVDTKTLSEAGVEMPIKKLDRQPLIARNGKPVTITLLGRDSTAYRDFARQQVKKRLQRNPELKAADVDFEQVEEESLELLVACTAGWSNVFDPDGKEIKFSKAAAKALYENYPVIREQVDNFIGERANFLAASSAS